MIAHPLPSADAEASRSDLARGLELRGLMLAQAQCGHADRARAAVDASMESLPDLADGCDTRMASSLFWRSLLAQPALRAELAHDPRNPFSQLSAGPRAALLLRRVAELDPEQAADALRVSAATYRHALDRALETMHAKGIEESVLRYVREGLQRAAAPVRAAPATDPDDGADIGFADTARRFRPALAGTACLLLILLGASYIWVPGFLRHGASSRGGFQALSADAPAATLDDTQSAVSGSDFDLLADPQGERIARDLDLYAWIASGSNAAAPAATAAALPEASLPEATATEADAEEPAEGASAATDSSSPAAAHSPAAATPKASASKDPHAH